MSVKLRLYKKVIADEISTNDFSDINYFLKKPSLFWIYKNESGRLKMFLWYLITFGRLKVFYIIVNGKIAHSSYIIPQNFRFPFMGKYDLQIGPCYTSPEFRGKGFYAIALKILPGLLGKTKTFWIYTSENNMVSRHVIEKCGYLFQKSVKISALLRILA